MYTIQTMKEEIARLMAEEEMTMLQGDNQSWSGGQDYTSEDLKTMRNED